MNRELVTLFWRSLNNEHLKGTLSTKNHANLGDVITAGKRWHEQSGDAYDSDNLRMCAAIVEVKSLFKPQLAEQLNPFKKQVEESQDEDAAVTHSQAQTKQQEQATSSHKQEKRTEEPRAVAVIPKQHQQP